MAQVSQNEAMLKEFECPVCFDYLKPPIRMCTIGHSICNNCRQKLKNCPTCRSNFCEGRNMTLESIAQKIKYPCCNARYGCTEKIMFENKTEHEIHCPYKMIRCPMYKICLFSGLLKDHFNHCQTNHCDSNQCDLLENNSKIKLIKYLKDYFWYQRKIIGENVYYSVQMIGNSLESSKYKYKIVIKQGDKRRNSFTDVCNSLIMEEDDLFSHKNSFCLSFECWQFYCNDLWRETVTVEKK